MKSRTRPEYFAPSSPGLLALKLVLSMAVPWTVGVLSSWVTSRGVDDWYPTLVKPVFTPPPWVFGPVWAVLYLMMGLALFLVWRRGSHLSPVAQALGLFALQLVLNGLWSLLFFEAKVPGVALVEILLLWLAIVATIRAFWRVTPVAGGLLLPYLAWVSFAAVLNAALWWLNRARPL